jgi:hypothetical protein
MSHVERVRHALSLFQAVMKGQSGELQNVDIAHMTGLPLKRVQEIMDHHGVLPREDGHFIIDKRTPIGYSRGAHGPSELFESNGTDKTIGVQQSRNHKKVDHDPTG